MSSDSASHPPFEDPASSEPQDSTSSACIEGRDYYVEEGKWVFTAFYLKQRGYCCQTGCRHCPYDEGAECV